MAGYDMFDTMIANIQEETVRMLFHVKVEQKVEREEVAKVTGTNKDEVCRKLRSGERKRKYTPMIRVPAAAARNINSAADVSTDKDEIKNQKQKKNGYFYQDGNAHFYLGETTMILSVSRRTDVPGIIRSGL